MFTWKFWLARQPVFQQVAEDWQKQQQSYWGEASRKRAADHFTKWVYPHIGAKKISLITPADIATLVKICGTGAPSRGRLVLQQVSRVFKYAKACGWSSTNPAEGMAILLPPVRHQGFIFLHPPLMPEFLRTLDQKLNHNTAEYTALYLLAYTALRRSEVCNAQLTELDLDLATWIIPAERMKLRRSHLVPLAPSVVTLLRQWLEMREQYRIVGDKLFGGMKVYQPYELIKRIGWQKRMTIHGFRKVFSTVAHESNLWGIDVIELQLAHTIPGVRGVYNKASMLNERRRMMNWYAEQIDQWRGLIP